MAWIINPDAVALAEELIDARAIKINSVWSIAQPSPVRIAAVIADEGIAAFGRWHLAIDPAAAADDPARYHLLMGDFRNLHDTALRAARLQAIAAYEDGVVAAIDDLLDTLARMNAC